MITSASDIPTSNKVPRKSYKTRNRGNHNVVENGSRRSGVHTSFDTFTDGVNNEVVNSGDGKEPKGADTVTKYLTDITGLDSRVFNGVYRGSNVKMYEVFQWTMASILLASVATLLLGKTTNVIALFISLGSFSALAISIIPGRYWHKMYPRSKANDRTDAGPTTEHINTRPYHKEAELRGSTKEQFFSPS
ncbi:hypothetical protein MPER_12382 [Moniliophthora perniciosa FA553]|nr:hypothetical protein MPER_12382 [Moniliophthora perniciosa FA553]